MQLPPLAPTRNMSSRRKAQPKVEQSEGRELSPPSLCTAESHEAPFNTLKKPPGPSEAPLPSGRRKHSTQQSPGDDWASTSSKLPVLKRRANPSQNSRKVAKHFDGSDDHHRGDALRGVIPRDLGHVPPTLEVTSINGEWYGTFHLHEFLQASSPASANGEAEQLRHPHGRLPPCVTDGRTGARITPREAERRAGKGSRKAWKQTLRVLVRGQTISLQKYMTQLGVDGHAIGDGGSGSGSGAEEVTELRASKSEASLGDTLTTLMPSSQPVWWTNNEDATSAVQQVLFTCSPFPFMPFGMLQAPPTAWQGNPSSVWNPPGAPVLQHSSPLPHCQMLPFRPPIGLEKECAEPSALKDDPCNSGVITSPPTSQAPQQGKVQSAEAPATISIFAGSAGEVTGIFYLHEFLRHPHPTKPPACIEMEVPPALMGDTSRTPSPISCRLTPTAAEAFVGRASRKNWKETFKTMHDGRILTLGAFLTVLGLDRARLEN